MKNKEIEMLFVPLELILNQYEDNIKRINEYSERLNSYFIENYKKNPEILFVYIEKIGAEKLINVEGNVEILYKILNNEVFFSYFKKNNLSIYNLIQILTIYNNSSAYFVENEKREEELMYDNLKKIKEDFDGFLDSAKKLYDFELWFNENAINSLSKILEKTLSNDLKNEKELMNLNLDDKKIESIVNFKVIFENYYQNMKNMYENKKKFPSKEKNMIVNYFIRELSNIFNTINLMKIPNKVVIELVSIIFDKNLDDTQIKNIMKNSNKHVANTSYTLQFVTGESSNSQMEYIKSKNCL